MGLYPQNSSALEQKNVACERIVDHTSKAINTDNIWYSVNDNVMGGRSLGSFRVQEDHLEFFGEINTNGGGFASIRHDIENRDLSGIDRIRLSIKTAGRTYSLNLRDQAANQKRLSHTAPIQTPKSDGFQTLEVPLSTLIPTFRGTPVQAQTFDPANAHSLSIMLSDGVDGPFALDLAWIEACRPYN